LLENKEEFEYPRKLAGGFDGWVKGVVDSECSVFGSGWEAG
jgi:hypothetical protein